MSYLPDEGPPSKPYSSVLPTSPLEEGGHTLHINKRDSEKLWNSLRYIYLHGRVGEIISLVVNSSPSSVGSAFNARIEGLKEERLYLSIPFENVVGMSDELC